MARLLDFNFFGKQESYSDFKDISYWLGLLMNEDSKAIKYLYKRLMSPVLNMTRNHRLNKECVEELINDSIVVFLQKLKSGQFVYQNTDPLYYVLEIARLNMNNYIRRSIKYSSSELTEDMDIPDVENTDIDEKCKQLEQLLSKLSPNCEKLIRLKYLAEMKDAEIIKSRITQYSTVDALKNQRAKCFKKLLELAQMGS